MSENTMQMKNILILGNGYKHNAPSMLSISGLHPVNISVNADIS